MSSKVTKIYLAGKIYKSDWRHELVPSLREAYSGEWESNYPWPDLAMYRKDFEYVGPYFFSCDHGCAHRPCSHGIVRGGCMTCWEDDFKEHQERQSVAHKCANAIRKCDILFAWLEYPCTAFGTLIEIGMARAQGKKIIIGMSEPNNDLWFSYVSASWVEWGHSNPAEAFMCWADREYPIDSERQKCESPLEVAFWEAYKNAKPNELTGLVAQHQVSANGKNYRLDFALPDRKIAFEMDGYTYHGKDQTAFNNDRRRDLDLKLNGWQVHRFDGDSIRADATKVVHTAATLATL